MIDWDYVFQGWRDMVELMLIVFVPSLSAVALVVSVILGFTWLLERTKRNR